MERQLVVIQVAGGKEGLLNNYLEKLRKSDGTEGIVVETFCLERQMKKRFQGKWNTVTERLFPGYLFVDTANSGELRSRLERVPSLARAIGGREAGCATLAPEEEAFVRKIGRSRGDHSIGISTVRIESDAPYKKGDPVEVVSGDLKDFEGEIVGYNFRKRKAMVRTGLFGGAVIHTGIELAENRSFQQQAGRQPGGPLESGDAWP